MKIIDITEENKLLILINPNLRKRKKV